MTDAQDTIDLPVFGLTLERVTLQHARARYAIRKNAVEINVSRSDVWGGGEAWLVRAVVNRGGGRIVLEYHTLAHDLGTACAALLAQMTPDDVAAIRALGER